MRQTDTVTHLFRQLLLQCALHVRVHDELLRHAQGEVTQVHTSSEFCVCMVVLHKYKGHVLYVCTYIHTYVHKYIHTHLFRELQVLRKSPCFIDQLLELLAQPQNLMPHTLLLCLCCLHAPVKLCLLFGVLDAEWAQEAHGKEP